MRDGALLYLWSRALLECSALVDYSACQGMQGPLRQSQFPGSFWKVAELCGSWRG